MASKKEVKNLIFKNFCEYWYFAKFLSINQRQIVFGSLSSHQQKILNDSFTEGQWEDVFSRNIINELLEDFESQYKFNLLEIKCKVMTGKSVYLPKKVWDDAVELLSQFKERHITFVLGGIKAIECKQNKDIVLVVPLTSDCQD